MNLPPALLHSLENIPGFDAGAFTAAHQQPAPVSIRLHPQKGAGLFADAPAVPWCPSGRYLRARPVFTLDPAFHAGAYYVQEASSMFLHHAWQQVMSDHKALRVLDLCGAPGGKSTLLASLLDRDSLLVANDVIRSRATILEENMTRWGYSNTWVASNDPRDFGRRLPGYFDALLVDAPCSGSGLFRKDAYALEAWSPEAVALCQARQQRILADVWPSLKEDGYLFYATCSYAPEEDEAVLDWLGRTFTVATVELEVPAGWGVVAVQSANGLTGYRFFPHRLLGEGFFIAVLQKKEKSDTSYYPKYRGAGNRKAEEKGGYLLDGRQYVFIENDRRQFNAIHPHHEPDFHLLSEGLYLRKAGVLTGELAQKDWIPAHDIALSIDRNKTLPTVDLPAEEALKYLKKEDVAWPELSKGWYIVTYKGNGLGWIKALSSRINNYLPKHWRIRMELPPENAA